MYEIFDNLLKLSGVSASVSSASSVSNSASETTSKSVYSDSMIDSDSKGPRFESAQQLQRKNRMVKPFFRFGCAVSFYSFWSLTTF